MSVSYTHLDVYKRQVWYSPFIAYDFNGDGKAEIALKTAPETTKRNEKGRVDSGEEYLSVWAVSYTHLDVYKRQIWWCGSANPSY